MGASSRRRRRAYAVCAGLESTTGNLPVSFRLESLEDRRLLAANAVDDELTTAFRTPIAIQPSQLLGNDVEVLRIISLTQPQNGTLVANPDGSFTYTPNSNFMGDDSFGYAGRSEANPGPGHFLDFAGAGQIRVQGFNWGVAISNAPPGPGLPKKVVERGSFSFQAELSAASAGILASLLAGRTGTSVDLVSRDAAGAVILRYRLHEPRFSSYAHSDASGSPVESFSIEFSTLTATSTSDIDGKPVSASTGWDFEEKEASAGAGFGRFPIANLTAQQETAGVYLRARIKHPTIDVTGTAKVEGALRVDSFSFDLSTPGATGTGGTSLAKPDFGTVNVSFDSGIASIAFFRALLAGDTWGEFSLTAPAGGKPAVRYSFTNVQLVSYVTSAGDRPLDNITFSYDRVEVSHTVGSKAGDTVVTNWNVVANAGTPSGQTHFGNVQLDAAPPEMFVDFGSGDIPVTGFTAGVARSRGASAAQLSGLSFSAPAGLHSPGLFASVAQARTIPSVVLTLRDGGGSIVSRWKLDSVQVTSYVSQSTDAGTIISFELNAARIEQTVTPRADGASLGTFAASYDFTTNLAGAAMGFGNQSLDPDFGQFLLIDADGNGVSEGQVRVESFNWGGQAPAAESPGGGSGAISADFSEVSLSFLLSPASAGLMRSALSGQQIQRATLVARVGGREEYARFLFRDTVITSYTQSDGSGSIPFESISLDAGAFEFLHTSVPGHAQVATSWDIAENKPLVGPNLVAAAPAFPFAMPSGNGPFLEVTESSSLPLGAVPILSFTIGDRLELTATPGGGHPAGELDFDDIEVLLERSSASAVFLSALARGTVIGELVLTAPISGGGLAKYTLRAVTVAATSFSDGSGGTLPVDFVSLRAGEIIVGITPPDEDEPIVAGWDLLSNTGTPNENIHFGKRDLNSALNVLSLPGGDIEFSEFTWGVSSVLAASSGTNAPSPNVNFAQFSFSAATGAHSPGLFGTVAGNYGLSGATITSAIFLGGKRVLAVWELQDILISSYSSLNNGGSSTDSFTLDAIEVKVTFTPLDEDDEPIGSFPASYDRATSTAGPFPGFGGFEFDGPFTTDSAKVTIDVQPPARDLSLSGTSIAEGSAAGTLVGNVTAVNPASQAITLLDSAGGRFALAGAQVVVASSALLDFETARTHTVRLAIGSGPTAYTEDFVISLLNLNDEAPILEFIPNRTGVEGGRLMIWAGATDPDGTGKLSFSMGNTQGLTQSALMPGVFFFTPPDEGVYSFTLTVSDGKQTDSQQFTVTAANAPPKVASFTAVTVNAGRQQEARAEFSFSDEGKLDLHTAVIDWGDGTSSPAQIVESGGTGAGSAVHGYRRPGIYTVTLTLRDDETVVTRSTTVAIAGIVLESGVLRVIGSPGNDTFQITSPGRDRLTVVGNFVGRVQRFSGRDVQAIEVLGLDGDDSIIVSNRVGLPVFADGGNGNDRITAGAAGAILVGGAGDDQITGGAARDLLIGGLGADRLDGRGDEDILVAGQTDHDRQRTSLSAILAEWSSSRSPARRIANLRGGGPGALNGEVFLNTRTVQEDRSEDMITLTGGRDWVFSDRRRDSITRVPGT